MKSRVLALGLSTMAAMLLLSGCATMDKAYVGMTKMTNPDKLKLTEHSKWLNPQPNLRPVSGDKMVAYVRVRNSSGSDVDVSEQVRYAVEDMGYRVTRNIDEAQFVLNADIRFFGENALGDGGASLLAAGVGGAVVGGVIGNVTGAGSGRATGTGAALGAAAGMMSSAMKNRNKIREIDLVLDVRLGERIEGGVTTTRGKGDESALGHSTATVNGGGFEGGAALSTSTETQSVVVTDDFFYSDNRLAISITKMNLTVEEALPLIEKRLKRAISNTLP